MVVSAICISVHVGRYVQAPILDWVKDPPKDV